MENEYDDFFESVRQFLDEQKKQKQRGINDYNMVNVVRKENAEVGMHSNVIYSLINPDGLHYQDDLFLKLFIRDVLKIDDFGEVTAVESEEQTTEGRRIDFTIKSSKYYIGIEMKIDAKDLDNQISDYEKDLKEKAEKNQVENVIIFYLTKDGKEASIHSHKDITYKQISFEEDVLNWINSCQHEVRNITNLNEAFENYKDIVKKIIDNNYRGKVMQLKDKLLEDEKSYKLAQKISHAFIEAKNEKIVNFKAKKIEALKNIVGDCITLPWFALDFVKDFHIRIIANENEYLIQITDKIKPFEVVEVSKKESILSQLKEIDNNFVSSYNKVYGAMHIRYDTIQDIQDILSLLNKLFALKA